MLEKRILGARFGRYKCWAIHKSVLKASGLKTRILEAIVLKAWILEARVWEAMMLEA